MGKLVLHFVKFTLKQCISQIPQSIDPSSIIAASAANLITEASSTDRQGKNLLKEADGIDHEEADGVDELALSIQLSRTKKKKQNKTNVIAATVQELSSSATSASYSSSTSS